jgi:ADP-ribosylglycohydrolase
MNGFWKLRGEGITPREAGEGNMASSSSAMCISPIGIINPGDPRQAALETYELVSIIHHNYCRDAACSMAAAVAAAFQPEATVDTVLAAAVDYLPPSSAQVMRQAISETLALARESQDYEAFRAEYYANHLRPGIALPESRETVPVTLALVLLAEGDPRQTIIYGANFGRDADTIASMAGAIAGALQGADAFPTDWLAKVEGEADRSQQNLAERLVAVIEQRLAATLARLNTLQQLT